MGRDIRESDARDIVAVVPAERCKSGRGMGEDENSEGNRRARGAEMEVGCLAASSMRSRPARRPACCARLVGPPTLPLGGAAYVIPPSGAGAVSGRSVIGGVRGAGLPIIT